MNEDDIIIISILPSFVLSARERKKGADCADCGRLRLQGSHLNLADELEKASPYLHLHSPDLAFTIGFRKPGLRVFPLLSESPLLQSVLLRHYGHSQFIIMTSGAGPRAVGTERGRWSK